MASGMVIDDREFQKTMVDYAAASKKDFNDIVDRTMGNLALRSAQAAKRFTASKAEIRALESRDWWPKFISKVLSGGGQSLRLRRKARTSAERNVWWKDTATGQMKFGRKTVSYTRGVGNQSKRADKRRISKQIIRRRIATVGSFVAIYSWIASRFIPGKVRAVGRKNYGKHLVATARTRKKPIAEFRIPFKSSRKIPDSNDAKNVSGKVRIAEKALRAGMTFVINDMRTYIDRKMGRTAKKYSARGAR